MVGVASEPGGCLRQQTKMRLLGVAPSLYSMIADSRAKPARPLQFFQKTRWFFRTICRGWAVLCWCVPLGCVGGVGLSA